MEYPTDPAVLRMLLDEARLERDGMQRLAIKNRDELDTARRRIAEFALIWVSLTPDQRTAIRKQSEELYDALGRSATQHYLSPG